MNEMGRHEIKYIITKADGVIIKNQLEQIMQTDIHSQNNGKYLVRSLYFDNIENRSFNQKLFGINCRMKFRVRLYNNDSSFMNLEKKSKKGDISNKEKCIITVEELESIINGDIDWMQGDERPLMREFYLQTKLYHLRPKTIVEYTREAYYYPYGNVRVTLDSNIKTGVFNTDIHAPSTMMVDAAPEGQVTLEVKYDEYLPDVVRMVVRLGSRRSAAISKYLQSRIYG